MGDEEDQRESEEAVRKLKARLRGSAGKGAARGGASRVPVTSVAKVESDRSRKNSRVKGSRAELDVAQMFSRWSGELVRRTPLSGGWSNAKFGVNADLVCANPCFPYSCEIKHREGWVLDDLVTGRRREHDKSVVQWWIQCVESCPKIKHKDGVGVTLVKEPLLVFRRNRQPWLAMMRRDAVNQELGVGTMFATLPAYVVSAVFVEVAVLRLDVFLDLEPCPRGLANHGRVAS